MKLAIVIVGYNNLNYSKICLDSVFKYTSVPYHVFFVDNGSKDDTSTYMRSLKKSSISLIRSDDNRGFAGGNNLALKQVLSDPNYTHVLLLNNDTIVTKDYIERMLRVMERDNKIGLVGPMSNYVGGRQFIGKGIPSTGVQKFAAQFYRDNQGKSFEMGRLVGFCVLMKRDVLEKVGLLDEIYGLGQWEDNDYALRCRTAGFISYVAADTFIYHFGSKTLTHKDNVDLGKVMFKKNKKVFYDKWSKINKIGEKKRIIGKLRVKNGGELLRTVLGSVSRMVDEIVVFDDHSTDNTKDICKSFSKVVLYYESHFDTFDEARDRNILLQMAKSRTPDWIYSFDSDEEPEENLIQNIQALVNDPDPEVKLWCFKICHLWKSNLRPEAKLSYRTDGLWGQFWQGRLFKNECNQEIKGDDDGLHSGSHPSIPPENTRIAMYRIKHYGNLDPEGRARKYVFYTTTDKKKDRGAILGAWAPFYEKLYKCLDKRLEGAEGLRNTDYYRHIVDESTLELQEWKEYFKISLAMIAKNEEDWIESALKSTKGFAHELVVVDTGSTDKTVEIIKKYTDKIYHLPWNNNFAEARNFAVSNTTGDWILRLDADEILPEEGKLGLWNAVQNGMSDLILFPIHNYQDNPNDTDNAAFFVSETVRLYRKIPGLIYTGEVHEELDDSVKKLSKIHKLRLAKSSLPIWHFGYLKGDKTVSAKFDNYISLAEKQIERDPKNFKPYFNLAMHYYHSGLLDKAEEFYKKSLELNPDQFVCLNDLGAVQFKKALKLIQPQLKKAEEYFLSAQKQVNVLTDKTWIQKLETNLRAVRKLIEKEEKEECKDGLGIDTKCSSDKLKSK